MPVCTVAVDARHPPPSNPTLPRTDLRSAYVDLFLLHYAECWGDLCGGVQPEGDFLDSWRALEELYHAGLARAIGADALTH